MTTALLRSLHRPLLFQLKLNMDLNLNFEQEVKVVLHILGTIRNPSQKTGCGVCVQTR